MFFKKLAFGYPRLWSSVPHFPTGRRLLLNIPPTQEDVLTDDNSLQNASNNEFLFSGKFPTNHSTNNCGPNKNMSCAENSLLTDSRQIFQSAIIVVHISHVDLRYSYKFQILVVSVNVTKGGYE
ncbi:unnamed protein product [Schistosoma mattheei]|uniref:Uncharacterized protein n=1 Tax=Schistosoma mattheei TaxID=31246 RepID=A0A3P8I213_9TREM|nr:unnamed protein product [Schistosoma mattheei]